MTSRPAPTQVCAHPVWGSKEAVLKTIRRRAYLGVLLLGAFFAVGAIIEFASDFNAENEPQA